jgi:FixJ family two-component response regulator/anti-sigma regulatory factor (Ser/Thr protein kinase)
MNGVKKIYIVEKSDTTRNSLKELFVKKGYTVAEATAPKEIISNRQLSSFSCIITSLDFSGGQTDNEDERYLQELIQNAPNTPVILLSSNINVAKTVESFKKGVFYIVKKPILLKEVEKIVNEAVSTKQQQEEIENVLHHAHSQFLFEIPGALGQIEGVIDHIAEETAHWKIISPQDDTAFRAALRAALHNAVLHGNKADDKKNVKIRFTLSPKKCHISVSDEGDGFHVEDFIDKDNLSSSKTSGGLLRIYSFMDEVSFNEKGNTLRMVKNRVAV